jgi:hypothetical protein
MIPTYPAPMQATLVIGRCSSIALRVVLRECDTIEAFACLYCESEHRRLMGVRPRIVSNCGRLHGLLRIAEKRGSATGSTRFQFAGTTSESGSFPVQFEDSSFSESIVIILYGRWYEHSLSLINCSFLIYDESSRRSGRQRRRGLIHEWLY